jgi:hypothetical protein
MRRIKEIVDNTSNRCEFNRAYKSYLERKGKIHCSYCGYNRGENDSRKWYGTTLRLNDTIRYPSWKLVSKNRKQWMDKDLNYIIENVRGQEYTTIKFKR